MAFLWGASAQQQEWDQLIGPSTSSLSSSPPAPPPRVTKAEPPSLSPVRPVLRARQPHHSHQAPRLTRPPRADKATSDLLPANSHVDLPDALHLADLLRSAQVPPQHATASLVRRLRHPNPNVQLLALELADLCVKNGGTPFLVCFSRGAADHGAAAELELLARGVRAGGGVHRDVKERVLARLQDWATAFKAKHPGASSSSSSSSSSAQLADSELVRVYDRLLREGVAFPPRDPTATAAMVDSLSAPDWADAPYCTRCRTDFSTFNRKHHCRNCGNVFDAQCSSGSAPLPHYGILEPVRVCDACLKKVREGKGASVVTASASAAASASPGLARSQSFGGAAAARPAGVERSKTSGGSSSSSRAAAREREDDDLRRAIEASLKDVEPDSLRRDDAPPAPVAKPGYHPSYASQVHGAGDSKRGGTAALQAREDDDPDLAAAIAASLRDLQPPATAPTFSRSETASTYGGGGAPLTYAQMFPSSAHDPFPSSAAHPSKPAAMALPSYDLTPAESATLDSFVALYATGPHGHPPPSGYLGARERGLYDEARGAQARLARAEEDARRRGEILREMEWKLSEAARLYGAGLTERASASLLPLSLFLPPSSSLTLTLLVLPASCLPPLEALPSLRRAALTPPPPPSLPPRAQATARPPPHAPRPTSPSPSRLSRSPTPPSTTRAGTSTRRPPRSPASPSRRTPSRPPSLSLSLSTPTCSRRRRRSTPSSSSSTITRSRTRTRSTTRSAPLPNSNSSSNPSPSRRASTSPRSSPRSLAGPPRRSSRACRTASPGSGRRARRRRRWRRRERGRRRGRAS